MSQIDDLLQKVKGLDLNIVKNQSYPGHLAIEDRDQDQRPGCFPHFDIGITWHNKAEPAAPDNTGPADLKISRLDEDAVIAKNDLWFFGSDSDEQIDLNLRYNSDLYKKATMEKLITDFLHICNDAVNDQTRFVLS